jgi:hypothetical protein
MQVYPLDTSQNTSTASSAVQGAHVRLERQPGGRAALPRVAGPVACGGADDSFTSNRKASEAAHPLGLCLRKAAISFRW